MRFECFGGILETLRGILGAFWWQLISFLQPCKAKMAPKKAQESEEIVKHREFFDFGRSRGVSWTHLGRSWERLGGSWGRLGGLWVRLGSSWRGLGGS